MKRNMKQQITAVILSTVLVISAASAAAQENKDVIIDSGFINPLDEPLATIGEDGFIIPLEKPLPVKGQDGFISGVDVELPAVRSDGFIIAPQKPMPKRGDDGFVIPLEKEIPERKDGEFIASFSELIPETLATGFLKTIPEADERAKIITTAQQLASISSGRYRLGCDIDLSDYNDGVWYPISPNGSVQLDGQGYKIYNLNIPEESNEVYAGLFGSCYYSVKITNLALVNNIAGKEIAVRKYKNEKIYAGGFVAKGNVIMDNCYSNVPITVDNSESFRSGCYVGGLIGCSDAVVKNSYYEGYVDVSEKEETNGIYSGGILAIGTINAENCFNRGNIYAGNSGGYESGTNYLNGATAGGILATGGGYITRCINLGEVSAQAVGGLVGCAGDKLTVKNSYNAGKITALYIDKDSVVDEYYAGGLIGRAESCSVENCYNSAEITKKSIGGSDEAYGSIGGLIGKLVKAQVQKSYNSGDITYLTNDDIPVFTSYSGGITGEGEELVASECYNSGEISGRNAGGILGNGFLDADHCCNYGEIYAVHNIGGISGSGKINAESCINKGKITFENYSDVWGEENTSCFAGGIVGKCTDLDSHINNCVNEGQLYSSKTASRAYLYHSIGGIAGRAEGVIENSCNAGSITVIQAQNGDVYAAGIFASGKGSVARYCFNEGSISTPKGEIAGITCAEREGSTLKQWAKSIEGCYNAGKLEGTGDIYGIGKADEGIKDSFNSGDITGGRVYGTGIADEFYNCYNTGDVEGGEYGIGESSGDITYCYNSGNLADSNDVYGIGTAVGNISFCYNTGKIDTEYRFVYGCAGIGEAENIISCFNSGALSGEYVLGIGTAKENIKNCYNSGNAVNNDETDTQYLGIGKANYVSDCYNAGNYVGECPRYGAYGVGYADIKIERCFNSGTIDTGKGADVYGIGIAPKVSESYNSGALYGANVYGIGGTEFVEDCCNSGNITVSPGGNIKNSTAGISGSADIVNCYNTGNIEVTFAEGDIAGVAGIAVDSKNIASSYNLGDITVHNGTVGVGGISANDTIYVGTDFNPDDLKVVNCFNGGDISSTNQGTGGISAWGGTVINCYNTGSVDSAFSCGGIMGKGGNIINSYNSGKVTSGYNAGGLAGFGKCSIANSYNTGEIYVSSSTRAVRAGGLIGTGGGTITDSFNSGSVMAVTTAVPEQGTGERNVKSSVGGLVGSLYEQLYADYNIECDIINSRNHAKLTAYSSYYIYLGGIVSEGTYYSKYDGTKYYDVPYLSIDPNTYSTGVRHFNCKAPVTDEHGYTHYYSYNGEVAGTGFVGTIGGLFPDSIDLKGRKIICTDETVEFKAVLTPSEGVDKTLVWISTDPSVAEVDENGNVTGIGEGKTVITATTKNGLTASREVEVVDDAMIIEVMGFVEDKPDEPYLLPGATVDVGGVVKITDEDGIAVFRKKELPDKASENVVVSCGEDYVPSEKLLPLLTYSSGLKKFHFNLKYRSENIYITKAQLKLDGKFDDVIGVSTIVGIPLFGKDNTLNEKGYSFNAEIDWNRCTENVSARKIYLYGTESGKMININEGVSSVAFAKTFNVGEPIKLIAKTLDNEGNEVRAEKTIGIRVRIVDIKLDMPSSPEITVEGPNWLKKAGENLGLRLSLDDISDYGGNVYYKNGILKIRLEMKDNTTEDHKNRLKKMELIRNANPIDVGVYGEISIPITEDGQGQWSGNIGASTIGVTADYEDEEEIVKLLEAVHNFQIGPAPLFISFTLSGGATASMGIGGKVYDAYYNGNMTGKARGAIRGGVGRKHSDNFEISFGPTGMLTFIMPFDFKAYGLESSEFTFNPSLEGNILAELIVDTKFVDLNGELELGNFTWDKDGFRWENIAGEKKTKLMSNREFSGLRLKNVGRAYLENGGGFNGNAALMRMRSSKPERSQKILYENIVKTADAAVCVLDGNPCLIYTYDNLLRDEANGLTAMYSIKTDIGWSEPKMLMDDGTIDGSVAADGKFVAWRDKKSEISDDVTLEELFKADEISAAVYNGVDFETIRLTDNDTYDFGVKVASNGDKAVVAWLSNDAADFTSSTGTTSLNYVLYNDGWSNVSTVSDIGTVSNINVNYSDEIPEIVYKNAENEFYRLSAGKAPVRLFDNIGRYAFSNVAGQDVTAYFDEENIIHIISGNEEVKTVKTEFIGNENPIIASNGSSASVFWIEEDGIYYVTNVSGEWSEKLQFVSSDKQLKKLSATFTDENSYFVSYFESDGETMNLMSVDAYAGMDLKVSDVKYDEKAYISESELAYEVKLFNNGEIVANGGTVFVYENGEELSRLDFNNSILPGESIVLSGAVSDVDLSEKHNYTFEIVSQEDYNSANNQFKLSVGTCDVRLQDAYFTIDELGRENLVIEVANNGNISLDGASIRVCKNGEEEKPIYEFVTGGIKPGEYAPIILDEVQDKEAIYYIVVECEEDEAEYNNKAMIAYERPEEEPEGDNELLFDKKTGNLLLSMPKGDIEAEKGKAIIAVYNQEGVMKKIFSQEADFNTENIVVERQLADVSDGDVIKLMLWSDYENMVPLNKSFKITVMP